MIAGQFHEGSGLGNQLARYVAVRVLAKDKGYEWGMVNPQSFKGEFMNIDLGRPAPHALYKFDKNMVPYSSEWLEKKVTENGLDIRSYDPEFNFIQDNTIIDGEFQDPRYFEHRMDDITEWLKVEPLEVPDDVCVIGFRGGEYSIFPELFLTKEYWDTAIAKMRALRPNVAFEVHTDDPALARQFFPDFKIIDNIQLSHSNHSNMGLNWRAMRYAKYAIIANSSFYILPRLIRHHQGEAITIAPRYWARRNIQKWAMPSNYYRQFTYL